MNGTTYKVLVSLKLPEVLAAGRWLLLHSLKRQLDLVQIGESLQWSSGKVYPRVVSRILRFIYLRVSQSIQRTTRAGGKLSEHNPKFHIHQLCELQNLRTTKISNLQKPYKNLGK